VKSEMRKGKGEKGKGRIPNRSATPGATPGAVAGNASLAGGPYSTNGPAPEPDFDRIKELPPTPAGVDLARSLAGPMGMNLDSYKKGASQWREWLDPLIALGPWRVWSIERASQLGMWADFQWLLRFVIREDGLMLALVNRWQAEVGKLEWDVESYSEDELPPGCTKAEADEQAKAMRRCYRQITNLRHAVEFLSMAKFHHFAHLEIVTDDAGNVCKLEPVKQWHWKRKSEDGPWCYDAAAYQSFAGVEVDPAIIVVRTVEHYVGRLFLRAYLAKNGGQRAWQEFVQVYNLLSLIIIGPPNVPKEQEGEYRTAAERISQGGGSGYLPNGSDAKSFEGSRQAPPAPPYIEHWDQQITLAVTGGLLTSLAMSGSGTLAGGAHADVFAALAEWEGVDIADCLDRQLTPRMLEPNFPGRPKLCRFVLSIRQAKDPAALADIILKISQAGFVLDAKQVSEVTSFSVTPKQAGPGPIGANPGGGTGAPGDESGRRRSTAPPEDDSDGQATPGQMLDQIIKNRAQADGVAKVGRALADDLAPVRNELERILGMTDPDEQLAAARELMEGLPDQLETLGADPEAAKVLAGQMREAFAEGANEGGKSEK